MDWSPTIGNELPALILNNKTRNNKKFQQAVLDAFERIALEQVRFNIEEFSDFYDMYDGNLSKKELKMVIPEYEYFQNELSKAEIDPIVYHWDIIGGVVNILVGKLIQMQDKFHVTDTGEVAESDLMNEYDKKLREILQTVIDNKLSLAYAEAGIDPSSLEKITDENQRQQLLQQLDQIKRQNVAEYKEKLAQTAKFKTAGVTWGEATLEKDRETLDFDEQNKEVFKNYILSGVGAKIIKIVQDTYKTFVFDSRTVFHSKDIGKKYLNDFSYAGRLHFQNPTQVIEEWGDYLDFNTQKKLLEGDDNWKKLSELREKTGSIKEVLDKNFHDSEFVPYTGYNNMLYMKRIEELTGLPMGQQIIIDNNGETISRPSYIPRKGGNEIYQWFANHIEKRFPLNTNICQVTEVYFRAMEPIGYLTYEDEDGVAHYGEIVTEDILKDFLTENNIKNIRNKGIVDVVDNFEMNTIVWQLRPVTCWGVKIVAPNSLEPIYLGVKPMEHQIKGLSDTDVKLPITGIVGNSLAKKMSPWQEMFNFNWNSIRQLLEKELGMFFLMMAENIPSQFQNMDDPETSIMNVRNAAKKTGIMLGTMDADGINPSGVYNQFSVHNVSHASEIETRYRLASISKNELYASIGIHAQEGLEKTQYATNEGIKVSQEAMQTQLAYLFDDFNKFLKVDLNQHLSVAQFVQANNMDKSMYYTKSDLSINWLKVNDPKLPLRNLGIIVTEDSRKKKELAEIKQVILNRNTMDADAKELIEITTSDSWRELVDKANQERAYRQEQASIAHQRTMEQIDATSQARQREEEEKWKREEYSRSLDRANKIHVETIDAYGKASDRDANAEDFRNIDRAKDQALKEIKQKEDIEAYNRDLDIKSEDIASKERIAANKQDLEKEKLRLKEKEIDSKEKIATINKN